MNCNTCGFYNDSNDTHCKNCNAPLNNTVNIFGEDILISTEMTNSNDNVHNGENIVNDDDALKAEIDLNNDIYNKVSEPNNDILSNSLVNNLDNNVIETTVVNDNLENIDNNKDNINNDKDSNIDGTYLNYNKDNNIIDTELNINNVSKNKPNKSEPLDMKKTLIIVGGIVLASLIILISVIIGTKSSKNRYSGNTSTVVSEDYKISFSGYDITIPEDTAYEISGTSLIIKEKDEKWITIIEVSDFNYSKLVVNKDAIKKSYEELNMKVSSMSEKTYQGITYLTSEMVKNDIQLVLGITKASQTQSFVVISFKPDYKLSYDGLNNIAPILKNAKYTGANKSTSIKSDFFDFSKITG